MRVYLRILYITQGNDHRVAVKRVLDITGKLLVDLM